MEPTKPQSEEFKGQVSSTSTSHPETGMRRDNESIDDFEHLEPESSPVKEFQGQETEIKMDKLSTIGSEIVSEISHVAPTLSQDTDISFTEDSKLGFSDNAKSISGFGDGNFVSSSSTLTESTVPLHEGKDFVKPAEEVHDPVTLSTHHVEPEVDELISVSEFASKLEPEFDVGKISSQKALSQAFMDFERENTKSDSSTSYGDTSEKFTPDVDFLKSETKSTSVPELDIGNLPAEAFPADISSSSHDTNKDSNVQDTDILPDPFKADSKLKGKLSDEIGSSKSSLSAQEDEDYDIPSQDSKPEKEQETEPKSAPLISEPHIKSFEPVKPATVISEPTVKPETVAAGEPDIRAFSNEPLIKTSEPAAKSKPAEGDVDLEEIKPIQLFHSMGLDAWFKPDRLHPKVVELVYWRDPKKSGIVFGSVLGVLLSLSYFSLISVVAYLSLALLTGTISFRIYKNVLQAVQKTSDGHPFKDILELDLTLPQDKVREVTDIAVAHVNAAALELRRLFLVEDLVDSIKFGVLLWCLTYVGSWFNGMTLIIIAFVALFTLPKVYENNKAQIDQNLDVVRSKIADITSKVKAAIPIGKKQAVEEEKKDQ